MSDSCSLFPPCGGPYPFWTLPSHYQCLQSSHTASRLLEKLKFKIRRDELPVLVVVSLKKLPDWVTSEDFHFLGKEELVLCFFHWKYKMLCLWSWVLKKYTGSGKILKDSSLYVLFLYFLIYIYFKIYLFLIGE